MDRTGAQRVMKNIVTYLGDKNYNVILVNDFDIGRKDSFDISNKVKRVFLRKNNCGNVFIKNIDFENRKMLVDTIEGMKEPKVKK